MKHVRGRRAQNAAVVGRRKHCYCSINFLENIFMKPYKHALTAGTIATVLTFANLASAQDAPQASAPAAPLSKKEMRAQNHQLVKKVRLALAHTKNLNMADITVLAKGGHVTLVGTVPDDGQISLAAQTAGKTAGVTDLTNNLTVHEIGN
ncbi:BON domain-containing protein [Paraburkholderia sp. BCC1884]|uniref:BON domain-containing protein n=1 Tax=Paraburkholderia sp. BCC1884 TaxID=2562668 RepID=UPI0021B4C4FF|nr:BON domain-containing protein [Paraburkholderia sp. BCC1884]